MAKTIHLVDGNSIARANHNGTVLTVGGPTGMQTQAIYGTLRTTKAILDREPGDMLFLWDGKAQWRLDLFPAYKGNRVQRTPEEEASYAQFKRQTPFIEKALELLGVKQARSPLLEADDLAKHVVRNVVERNAKRAPQDRQRVRLWSGDKDWIQLVEENVDWVDPIHDRSVTTANFMEFTGYFSSQEFVQGKALQGDGSDNIPGIHKLGEKTAQQLLAKWRDIHKFWAAVDSGAHVPATRKSAKAVSKHPEELLASPEGRAMVKLNLQLMDMQFCRRPENGEMVITNSPPNHDGFLHLCERLAFASILRERAMFLKHFN